MSDAPYSGVVHSGEVAGYTGAEGYTGVVAVPGSTTTTDAPVSEKSQPLSDETLAREFGILRAPPSRTPSSRPSEARPGRTRSPADAVVMERGEAPGQDAPLNYSPPPPVVVVGPTVDDQTADDRGTADEEDFASTEVADGKTAVQAQALAQLATSVINAQQRYASQPEPTPNRSLELAKALLRGSIVPDLRITPFTPLPNLDPIGERPGLGLPVKPFLQDLIGMGASALRRQAEEAVAATRPTNLGIAYLQGVGLGLFDQAVGIAEELAGQSVDPVGSALRQVAQIMQQIDEHIAQGESPWEAANSVLNPFSRLRREPAVADALAGRAFEAAAHDWDEAIRLSRESGRHVASAVTAAVESFGLVHGGIAGVRRLGTALPRGRARGVPPTPPTAPSAPALPRPPRPDRQRPQARSEVYSIPVRRPEANGVTGKVYRNGAERLPSKSFSRLHPTNPDLPVYDRHFIQAQYELQKGVPSLTGSIAAKELKALPADLRHKRPDITKEYYNQLERETALETALAKPGHAFLLQVEIKGVTLSDGIPKEIGQINASLGKSRGRIADHLDMAPDGRYTMNENKTVRAIVTSYSKRGVTDSRILPSSKLGGEIRRETNVFDYARQQRGAVVNVSGVTFDGRRVSTTLDPQKYRGPAPSPYKLVVGQ